MKASYIRVQPKEGAIFSVTPSRFHEFVKKVVRFSLGGLDFYGHKFYSVNDKGKLLVICEWDGPEFSNVYTIDKKTGRWMKVVHEGPAWTDGIEDLTANNVAETERLTADEEKMFFLEWPVSVNSNSGKIY